MSLRVPSLPTPSAEEPPAFGQVWRYTGLGSSSSPFMLIAPVEASRLNLWTVMRLDTGMLHQMAGLHRDPKQRIPHYTRVS